MRILHLLALLTILSFSAYSQKVDDLKITFEYRQLPLEPINKSTTNYSAKVIQTYEADINARKEAHKQKVKEAEDRYNADLAAHPQKVKEAEDRYTAEMEAYNKKNLGQKLLENKVMGESTKPVKNIPSAPYKSLPVEDKYQKIFSADLLSSTYVKLEGFKKTPENAVAITVTLNGFESPEPVLKTATTTKTENGVTKTISSNSYEVSYKHPISVKVEAPGQGTVLEETPASFNEYKIASTGTFSSESDLRNWWYSNKESYLNNLDDKIIKQNMEAINELINNKFGYIKKKREIEIYLAKDKEVHPDYQKAYESAIAGYNQLAIPESKDQVFSNIRKATELWEAALKESNVQDKKARVNEKVTIATIKNLIEAYIWLNDFNTSETYMNKLLSMDISNRDKKDIEKNRELLKSQRERFDINNK
jgi:hypothetical protein